MAPSALGIWAQNPGNDYFSFHVRPGDSKQEAKCKFWLANSHEDTPFALVDPKNTVWYKTRTDHIPSGLYYASGRALISGVASPAMRFEGELNDGTNPEGYFGAYLEDNAYLPQKPPKPILAAAPSTYLCVTNTQRGSPADRSGMKPGDVILELNNKAVDSAAAFETYVRDSPGVEISLKVCRVEEFKSFKVKLGKRTGVFRGYARAVFDNLSLPKSPDHWLAGSARQIPHTRVEFDPKVARDYVFRTTTGEPYLYVVVGRQDPPARKLAVSLTGPEGSSISILQPDGTWTPPAKLPLKVGFVNTCPAPRGQAIGMTAHVRFQEFKVALADGSAVRGRAEFYVPEYAEFFDSNSSQAAEIALSDEAVKAAIGGGEVNFNLKMGGVKVARLSLQRDGDR